MGHFELVCSISIFEDFILAPLVNEEKKKKKKKAVAELSSGRSASL
jgi:hypothetical protein